MKHIFICIYRTSKTAKWQPWSEGIFDERRLAENYLEIKKAQGYDWETGIVDGPIVSLEQMAEAEKRLGEF